MRNSTRAFTAVATLALVLSAAGCGGGTASKASGRASRVIDMTMTDNAFQPGQMQVTKGETVTMRFRNNGSVKHEAILGDDAVQMRHHGEMTTATAPMDHGGPHGGQTSGSSTDAITVEPGKTGEITHTFSESGTVLIGCHEPGHWEAGMKATVAIS
jgi:uncharacterized cupredoxin-like copper-binding protein